ncbi:hypothetical protein F5Y19DRAFT_361691 [Xylariaceae sp. FL1651]|nr:hypothetical protein F5Y19DRAFT_361691 [Xylariaceae sp. FL1651]
MSAKQHDLLTLQRAITSPQRPGNQLRRSITEQSPPAKQSRVHQYLHRKDRDRDDRLPLSANPPVRSSLDLPRSEAVTPSTASDTDRKPTMVFWAGENAPVTTEAATNPHRLHNKNEKAREQKDKAAMATASLRKSLVELNSFSNATIARLDETYSSVLQRLSSLQSMIVAIKELAGMSQDVDKNFTSESRALVSEIESQLSIYDQSDDQKKRIQDLQARIHAGRDRIQALSRRVDVVRERIEDWERADKEWQERTRKRLMVLWIIVSVVAFVLTVLSVGAQYTLSSVDINRPAEVAPGADYGRPSMDDLVGNNSKSVSDRVREELTRRRDHGVVEEEVFRAFDEL